MLFWGPPAATPFRSQKKKFRYFFLFPEIKKKQQRRFQRFWGFHRFSIGRHCCCCCCCCCTGTRIPLRFERCSRFFIDAADMMSSSKCAARLKILGIPETLRGILSPPQSHHSGFWGFQRFSIGFHHQTPSSSREPRSRSR